MITRMKNVNIFQAAPKDIRTICSATITAVRAASPPPSLPLGI